MKTRFVANGLIFERVLKKNLVHVPSKFTVPNRIDSMSYCLPASDQSDYPACFPSGTLVLKGDFTYVPIQNIRKGDCVFSHCGKIQKIITKMQRKWQGTMKLIHLWGDYRPLDTTAS